MAEAVAPVRRRLLEIFMALVLHGSFQEPAPTSNTGVPKWPGLQTQVPDPSGFELPEHVVGVGTSVGCGVGDGVGCGVGMAVGCGVSGPTGGW